MRSYKPKQLTSKSTILIIGSSLIAIVLVLKLFQLQVLAHNYYQEIATREQYGVIDLPAQRGEILIKDYHSNEEFLLATNTTLNLVYADPTIVEDPAYIGQTLHPYIFNLEEERELDNIRIEKAKENLQPDLTEEQVNELLRPKTDEELENQFKGRIIEKMSEIQRQEILLSEKPDKKVLNTIATSGLPGIEVKDDNVYAYPPQISNPVNIAEQLSPLLQIPTKQLTTILEGVNRYTVLQKKLDVITTDEIKTLIEAEPEKFHGIGFQEEYARYYPEGTLAANVVGYVSKDSVGQYGIESTFNTDLKGIPGKFQTKRDSLNRQITVGESILEPAVDGDDIILTIDRSIQLKVEKILEDAVNRYRANGGQILIMNPQTGGIIAMAHAPSFNPNNFGDVFKKVEFEIPPEERDNLYPAKNQEPGVYDFYINPVTLDKIFVFEEKDEQGNTKYYKYENNYGPEVYHNKIVSWPYEPGSIFKSIAMAIAIDDGDLTPNTKFHDEGPIGVDWNIYSEKFDFEIKNAEGYYGWVDMTTVLAKSLNTGMTFVAKEIGPALFYSYLDKFGFLDRTDIEFDTESPGKIEYFENWSESELATHAFGQGILVNMVQMANAYAVLANGGVLMQPHIIEEIRHDDGRVTKIEPHEIRRVISEEASDKMTSMLTYSTEYGVAKNAQVDGHYIAGKTGTSQTYKWGRAISGKGTTIASFAGYGPVDNPQFVILIKFDRPKENEWGSQTAAPVFSEIASYLFEYYNIPPDKYGPTTTTEAQI